MMAAAPATVPAELRSVTPGQAARADGALGARPSRPVLRAVLAVAPAARCAARESALVLHATTRVPPSALRTLLADGYICSPAEPPGITAPPLATAASMAAQRVERIGGPPEDLPLTGLGGLHPGAVDS
jgi:hypothetical protein